MGTDGPSTDGPSTDGPSTDQDAEDVAGALEGDPSAFRRIVERHQHLVFGFLGALLPGHADREDVAQEAFVAAWEHLPSFDPRRGALVGWLLAIARNRALNRRRALRRAEAHRPPPPTEATAPPPHSGPPESGDPRIDAAVAALPEDQRATFVLALVHGLPLATVARVEDVPLGTVKSRLSRAKEHLRATLRDLIERTP